MIFIDKLNYCICSNSIRNGTWPTSTNNLIGACIIASVLLLGEPEATRPVNKFLWSFASKLPLPEGTPRWISGGLLSGVIGLLFFLGLMKVRQYTLRALLAYRGWLCKKQQWGIEFFIKNSDKNKASIGAVCFSAL